MTDKDVERVKADIRFADGSVHRCIGRLRCDKPVLFKDEADVVAHIDRVNQLRGAKCLELVAALASTDTVTDAAKLGTVSLTSFDGHCVPARKAMLSRCCALMRA
jgi:hypothetical protein